MFAAYRLDEQIHKGLDRKVWLPSGGSLVIDRTEAMTVVDVNTGKFTGSGGNLEETVTKNNLEAAEEIVRQLRLRDIGGIIVVDFIDMVLESNRDLVLRRLVECLGRDRTRHQVAEVTSLGLVQMTRKRIGTGLLEAFSHECDHCHGRGVVIQETPVEPRRSDDDGGRRTRPSWPGPRGPAAERPVERQSNGKATVGPRAADTQGRRGDGQAPRRAPRALRAPRAPTTSLEAIGRGVDGGRRPRRRRGTRVEERTAVEEAPVEEAPAEEPVDEEPAEPSRSPHPSPRAARAAQGRHPDPSPRRQPPGRAAARRPRARGRRPARCWWTTAGVDGDEHDHHESGPALHVPIKRRGSRKR